MPGTMLIAAGVTGKRRLAGRAAFVPFVDPAVGGIPPSAPPPSADIAAASAEAAQECA